MYELVQVGENTFYMDCPAKVGIVRIGADEAVLIDAGSDKDAGKKAKRLLDAQGWKLKAIYNTHSHADHIGGNQYLQAQTGCRIFAPDIECDFALHPVLEPVTLYGGSVPKELQNKFLMAAPSNAERLTEADLPQGMSMIPLPGHSYSMVGFRTADDVVFLADSLAAESTLQKYQISYLYDVKAYLDTLETVKTLQAKCFVPAHADASDQIAPLAQANIDKTLQIIEVLKQLAASPKTFDDLLADVFTHFGLTMSLQQRMLVGSTVKSYLSYLANEGQLRYFFEDSRMLWQTV